MAERPNDFVTPLEGYAPAVGAALWALEDCRKRTLALVSDVHPALVDWPPPWDGNAIGSLLYHIAAIELDWLFYDILQSDDYPDAVTALFPVDVREEGGTLSPITGETIDQHLDRLAAVRDIFLASLRDVTDEDFRRARATDEYDVTPEWVIHHLSQHEAEHRGQIGEVLQSAALRAS